MQRVALGKVMDNLIVQWGSSKVHLKISHPSQIPASLMVSDVSAILAEPHPMLGTVMYLATTTDSSQGVTVCTRFTHDVWDVGKATRWHRRFKLDGSILHREVHKPCSFPLETADCSVLDVSAGSNYIHCAFHSYRCALPFLPNGSYARLVAAMYPTRHIQRHRERGLEKGEGSGVTLPTSPASQ